jgi:polysaccharide pyruvyl transferase WcaK-like protein
MRRKVVFAGAYGIQNAGDDAPLVVMTRALREASPEVEYDFAVLARHADPLLAEATGARFVPNPEYPSRALAAGKFFRGLNPGDERGDLERLEHEIRTADLVVAGAGNALVDLSIGLFRGPVPLLALYAFLADLHRTPLFLYGISAGPLATERGRELSSWIVRRAAAVTVRDEASRALLAELAPEATVRVLPDPVLGLEPAGDAAFERALERERIPRAPDRPRLALALRDLSFLGFDRGCVVAALRALAPRWELLFVPQCTDRECDDRMEAEAVVRELPGARCHVVRERHGPDVLARFYGLAAATLAVRLHGAVFSAMAGVPVVALSYLPKVRGFLERVGLERGVHELASVTPEALGASVEAARSVDREALRRRVRRLAAGTAEYAAIAAQLSGSTASAYCASSKQ